MIMRKNKKGDGHTFWIIIFAIIGLLVLIIGGMAVNRAYGTLFGFNDPHAFDAQIRSCMDLMEQRNVETTDTDGDGIYDLCDPCLLENYRGNERVVRQIYGAVYHEYSGDELVLSSINTGFASRTQTTEEIERYDADFDGIPNACDSDPLTATRNVGSRAVEHECTKLKSKLEGESQQLTVELKNSFNNAYKRCVITYRSS